MLRAFVSFYFVIFFSIFVLYVTACFVLLPFLYHFLSLFILPSFPSSFLHLSPVLYTNINSFEFPPHFQHVFPHLSLFFFILLRFSMFLFHIINLLSMTFICFSLDSVLLFLHLSISLFILDHFCIFFFPPSLLKLLPIFPLLYIFYYFFFQISLSFIFLRLLYIFFYFAMYNIYIFVSSFNFLPSSELFCV